MKTGGWLDEHCSLFLIKQIPHMKQFNRFTKQRRNDRSALKLFLLFQWSWFQIPGDWHTDILFLSEFNLMRLLIMSVIITNLLSPSLSFRYSINLSFFFKECKMKDVVCTRIYEKVWQSCFLIEVIFDHLMLEISCFHWQGLTTLHFVCFRFCLNRSDKQRPKLRINLNFSVT